MYKILIVLGVLLCLFSFGYFLTALMNIAPMTIGAPMLFLSIFFTIHCYNHLFRDAK